MRKLATPVQYESTLEGLNEVRPLQLKGEGKIVIPYPVLCSNPPTKDRPAVGKLTRCSQQGALLAGRRVVYESAEYITEDFEGGDGDKLIRFSQQVKYVVSMVVVAGFWYTAFWTDSTYTIQFKDIHDTNGVYIPFRGIDLYISVVVAPPIGATTIGFYGFY